MELQLEFLPLILLVLLLKFQPLIAQALQLKFQPLILELAVRSLLLYIVVNSSKL